jgi:hypothetical protein
MRDDYYRPKFQRGQGTPTYHVYWPRERLDGILDNVYDACVRATAYEDMPKRRFITI